MAKYLWLNSGYGLNLQGADAQSVGLALEELDQRTPEKIIAHARKNPVLNPLFEWDDSVAAHKYRLNQARTLVIALGIDSSSGPIRAFESVVIDKIKSYVGIEEIQGNESLYEQVMATALGELKYWKTKYQRYEEFFGHVFDAITLTEESYRSRKNGKKEKRSRGTGGNKNHNSSYKEKGRNNNNHRRLSASR